LEVIYLPISNLGIRERL